MNMDTGSGSLDVTSQNSTQIMAKVKPDRSDPTETACVTAAVFNPLVVRTAASASTTPAAGTAGSTCTDPDGNQGITVAILGAPKIKWNDKRISVTDDADPTPQPAVVGQQIKLDTEPKVEELAALGLSFLTNTWTAGGTSIGHLNLLNYKTKDPVLDKPTTTVYWLLQGTGIPVTYQYCVNIPGLSADDIAKGLNCSRVAKATFNVSTPSSVNLYTCGGDVTECSEYEPLGSVAITTVDGKKLKFGGSPTNVGIVFTASDDSSSPPGAFSYVQVIGGYTTTYSYTSGGSCSHNFGFGLDNVNPYPTFSPPSTTDDNPGTRLYADDTEVTADMTATMYLLWASSTVGSIPVPLGYVDWGWFGDAVRDKSTKTWSIKTDSGSQGYAGSFQDSSTYPSWSNVVHNGANPCAK